MNFWKLYISLILVSTTFAFASEKPIAVCGYSPSYEELYYPIIDQRIIGDSSLYPFLNCPISPFCDFATTGTGVQENLDDWRKFFGNNLSEETLLQLIYTETQDWYEKLEANNTTVVNSSLANKINKNLQKSFARYMMLAKQCEGIRSNNSGGSDWYQGEYDDEYDSKPELLELALKNYKAETNAFLKNRYGYQIVRLAHYLQENGAALKYFDNFLTLDSEAPYIYYLALEQRSGAAYNLKQLQQATKGFLEVYSKIPSRRENCALSLKYMDWSNPQLKDDFFTKNGLTEIQSFFKAYYFKGSNSREMQKLQNTNPKSPYLEVLAIREVDKLQNSIFENYDDGWNGYYGDVKMPNSESVRVLQRIALSQIENREVLRVDFWRIVLSATFLKDKQYDMAISNLSKIAANSEMYVQAKRLSFAIETLQLKTIDRREIDRLFSQLRSDKQLHKSWVVTAFFFNSVVDLYRKEGNFLLSSLGNLNYANEMNEFTWEKIESRFSGNFYYKNGYVKDEVIKKFQGIIDLPNKTSYEKFILSILKSNPQDFANELRGTWYFQQNRLEEAISYFQKIEKPSAFYGKNIRPEMFSGAIREYFNAPFGEQSDNIHLKYKNLFADDIQKKEREETYPDNKLKLAQTLLKLEGLAKRDPTNAADYYYMLGNAWYNMSESGWFLNSLHYIGNNDRNYFLGTFHSNDRKDMNDSQFIITATEYFKKARTSQGNRETKAKAIFMLAKTNYCYDEKKVSNGNYSVEVCGDHKDYFQTLKDDYSDTAFAALTIRECSWYRSFLGNR